MPNLRKGDGGSLVRQLQRKLTEAGYDTHGVDGKFGSNTEKALRDYQSAEGLEVTGVADEALLTRLAIEVHGSGARTSVAVERITVDAVAKMFPQTPKGNISRHLAVIIEALQARDMLYREMVLMALATIRAETESFRPISEGVSQYNTSPDGEPFDLYDRMARLGNTGHPDGSSFKGRGFIQLTGRDNYTRYSLVLGLGDGLVREPERANDPKIAAQLLAAFLKDHEVEILEALAADDLKKARKLVNGGSHGFDRFKDAFERGERVFA
jgi:peptidoglycan L-alanyl-D-glutamate endopeptidase CwlK